MFWPRKRYLCLCAHLPYLRTQVRARTVASQIWNFYLWFGRVRKHLCHYWFLFIRVFLCLCKASPPIFVLFHTSSNICTSESFASGLVNKFQMNELRRMAKHSSDLNVDRMCGWSVMVVNKWYVNARIPWEWHMPAKCLVFLIP